VIMEGSSMLAVGETASKRRGLQIALPFDFPPTGPRELSNFLRLFPGSGVTGTWAAPVKSVLRRNDSGPRSSSRQ
jgi:hypothetical protein